MPTYDYKCNTCSKTFEVFKSITDNTQEKCPYCRSENTQKLVGAGIGIIFKGSGFYTTDYKKATISNNNSSNNNNNSNNINNNNHNKW